jgi:16S rRNA (cytidine1402-2'-O)-methyltransferase
LGGEGYRFVGFLPRSASELRVVLDSHAHVTLVAFEAPHRLVQTLRVIADVQPDRVVVTCRELTKRHEEAVRGTAAELVARFETAVVKGEIVLVLGSLPHEQQDADPRRVALIRDLVGEGMRLRPAARIVSEHLGGSSRELYDAVSRDID